MSNPAPPGGLLSSPQADGLIDLTLKVAGSAGVPKPVFGDERKHPWPKKHNKHQVGVARNRGHINGDSLTPLCTRSSSCARASDAEVRGPARATAGSGQVEGRAPAKQSLRREMSLNKVARDDLSLLRSSMSAAGRELPTCCGRHGGGAMTPPASWARLPESIQGCLMSVGLDELRFETVADTDWSREWHGWQEVNSCMNDADVMAWTQRFLRVATQNTDVGCRDNRARVLELARDGFTLVAASGEGNNCLIDALMLCMASQGILPVDLHSHSAARTRARVACRDTFVNSADAALRPQQLSDLGQRLLVSDEEHARAFLQVETHGPAAVQFLLHHFGREHVLRNTAIKIVVYTRFDCSNLNPLNMATTVSEAVPGSEAVQAVLLRLYNQMDARGRGYHFDALVDCTVDANALRAARPNCEADVTAAGGADGLMLGLPQPADLHSALVAFVATRGAAELSITEEDVERVAAAWHRREELAEVLLTLLQSVLVFSDTTRASGRRLALQFRGFVATYCSGPGKELGTGNRGFGEGTRKHAAGKLAPSKLGRVRSGWAPKSDSANPTKCSFRLESEPWVRGAKRGFQERGRAGHAGVASACKRRRYSRKQPPRRDEPSAKRTTGLTTQHRDSESEAEDEFTLCTKPNTKGSDKRAVLDALLRDSAQELSEYPTLPTAAQASAKQKAAARVDACHCAYRDCNATCSSNEELEEHLVLSHKKQLGKVAELLATLSSTQMEDRMLLVAYRRVLDWKCQSKAPLACPTIDRRCLKAYSEAQSENPPETRICFLCARRFPHCGANRSICYERALACSVQGVTFLGLSMEDTKQRFGRELYEQRYVRSAEPTRAQMMQNDLAEWTCTIKFSEQNQLPIVCCPEDKDCCKGCSADELCDKCCIPICRTCKSQLQQDARMPREALANDLLVYYAPRELYEDRVTMMELICASPCFTSMICFSIEQKYRGKRALDEELHMQRHRQGARGNATTFLMDWEEVVRQLHEAENNSPMATGAVLPRTGEALSKFVSIILKSTEQAIDATNLARFIHQARVRRAVVMRLIEGSCKRGHPAFVGLDLRLAWTRAAALPEDGVPQEVITLLPCDDNLSDVDRQKVAAPMAVPETVEEVAIELDMRRPNAVVLEKTSASGFDFEEQQRAALRALAEEAEEDRMRDRVEEDGQAPSKEVVVGSEAIDQFAPWYFGVAFAYLFKYCTAMPDVPAWCTKHAADTRRPKDAPQVLLADWVRLMARRVESQLVRDWTFGYTTWNLLFRSAVNLSRTVYTYQTPFINEKGGMRSLTATDLEEAALEILRGLQGSYTDSSGRVMPVNGNFAKLAHCSTLSSPARRILANLKHTARALPGTQEARRAMRFQIQAMRVRYGTPIFVTVTPDESHQLLYVRMSRHRNSDPINVTQSHVGRQAGERCWPELTNNFTQSRADADFGFPVLLDSLARRIPNWEERRRILARDPLATVDGFHVLFAAVMQHLFGLKVCLRCPECNQSGRPCQDEHGSNASLSGGIFGRIDAAYIAIEYQKSSASPHGHGQLFVQCLHQHSSLWDIFRLHADALEQLRTEYLDYASHVNRCVYSEPVSVNVEEALQHCEREWPEYKSDHHLISRPAYQAGVMAASDSEAEAETWSKAYFEHDVFKLQMLKQHHVHVPVPGTSDRRPQRGCLKADKSNECKHGFPKTKELSSESAVLCPCRLRAARLPDAGRKNLIGALQSPRNNEWLNGTHPALLAGVRSNSDAQLPYRLPYKCDICQAKMGKQELRQIVRSAQRAQDAQTGYCCDYCAKTQPMAFSELKELAKGHKHVAETTQQRGTSYQGKRHMTRFLSDAYCKGIVRGQAECVSLRCNYQEGKPTVAERFVTTDFVHFPGNDYLRYVELAATGSTARTKRVTATALGVRGTRRKQKQLTEKDAAEFYARRPRNVPCWHLSPYEFLLYWHVVPTRCPSTLEEWASKPSTCWDVDLTTEGFAKLSQAAASSQKARLIPGQDTELKRKISKDLHTFEDTLANRRIRAAWLLQKRKRPHCPVFDGCPVPRYQLDQSEENSKLCMTYFRAWTGDVMHADADVVHASALRPAGSTWESALRHWLRNLPCEETKRHVGNFLSVYRVRGSDADVQNSDNDVEDETRVEVTAETFSASLQTRLADETKDPAEDKTYEDLDMTWQCSSTGMAENLDKLQCAAIDNLQELLREARRPPDATRDGNGPQAPTVRGPCVQEGVAGDIDAIATAWLREVAERATADGRKVLNGEQLQFVTRITRRVLQEQKTGEAQGGGDQDDSEPLRWVLHGGPGTGKTHVIKLLRTELFERILGWSRGFEFDITALQAVTADMLDGDTLHHAFGLTWRNGGSREPSLSKTLELAQRLLRMRWLIVDEISMVSVELLAQLEQKLRHLIRQGSPFKRRAGRTRPFGGLNVVVVGDLWQLEPPGGTFLASLPHEWLHTAGAKQRMLQAHGQELIWGGPEQGFQGVTELWRCERVKDDEWLKELQEQFRYSQLSNNNHAFLHGQPTTVPGSWTRETLACGNAACKQLVHTRATPEQILRDECGVCKEERRTRRLVATSTTDPRFVNGFEASPSIFATNTRKYHTGKLRAKAFAATRNKHLHYIVAQDRASAEVLREKPNLAKEKLRWLQRHDRECGDLCSVLPLCDEMPVFLTEHLNRQRLLLKGRRGFVRTWTPATDGAEVIDSRTTVWNKLPATIYVQFPAAH